MKQLDLFDEDFETRAEAYQALINNSIPPDDISQPSHYTVGGIQTIDYLRAKLTPEEFQGFVKGNIIKYLSRDGHKQGTDDIAKAKKYAEWL